MKYVIMIASFAILSACKPDTRERQMSEQGLSYAAECIDGVEYWMRFSGHKGYMSPRINPDTMTFVRCGDK
jgi:hypothetical protein